MIRRALRSTLFPYTTLFRSSKLMLNYLPGVPYAVWVVVFAGTFTALNLVGIKTTSRINAVLAAFMGAVILLIIGAAVRYIDRKSTRLNSSHANISYAVFCLK